MDPQTDKILTYFTELEQAAEDVLTDRRTIIDLDRKRNGNREALRHLRQSDDKKAWIVMGNTFFKFESQSVSTILQSDQEKLDTEIDELRNNMKKKMDKMRDLEEKPALKGFNLKPLDTDEVKAIYQTIGK